MTTTVNVTRDGYGWPSDRIRAVKRNMAHTLARAHTLDIDLAEHDLRHRPDGSITIDGMDAEDWLDAMGDEQ